MSDPVEQLRVTATIARTIYDGEAADVGLPRGASTFSAQLKKLEREFELARMNLQRRRVERLQTSVRDVSVDSGSACSMTSTSTGRSHGVERQPEPTRRSNS